MENFWTYFEVLAPSIGVGLVFWLAIRAIFRADRNERAAETEVREEVADKGFKRDRPSSEPHR
ncbi:hypothetical protein [Nesterenkonia sandarakina]|uniref:Uncharacterized protein n=1 Tax=Nesterenkonia sandarakina TaxID=272918 RepID=A0A2T0YQT8_9MICC|nr:hypothetical protein [Nesterenkonia sandarakina]PRZ17767.1 hypothetical protein BCL67_104116 [Nesterenkonia sandarakina]